MAKYAFLSPEWIKAAKAIQSAHSDKEDRTPVIVRMNLVVEGVPFGSGSIDACVDTTSGAIEIDTGHLVAPDVKVTLDYDTAKAILVDGDSQAGMQAFMAGRIRVEGDMTKLLSFQSGPPTPRQIAIANDIQDVTE